MSGNDSACFYRVKINLQRVIKANVRHLQNLPFFTIFQDLQGVSFVTVLICCHANIILKLRIEGAPKSKTVHRTFLWSWTILFTILFVELDHTEHFYQKIFIFERVRSFLVTQLGDISARIRFPIGNPIVIKLRENCVSAQS